VVDVISALTNSENPQVYWRVMKKRLIDEGSNETVTKCNGLKMVAPDGKMRLTDVADTEIMLYGYDYQRIQEFKRSEEGGSARQYDQPRIGSQYVSRNRKTSSN